MRVVPLAITLPVETSIDFSGTLSLECKASGRPTPTTFRWLKGGSIISSSRILSINSAKVADAGSYTCFVNNSIGAVAERSVIVRVRCKI